VSRLGFQPTLVECVHRRGEPVRARSIAETARTESRERGLLIILAETNLVLAGILGDGGDPGDVASIEGLIDEVDQIVKDTGARLFTSFTMERRAMLATLRGDETQRMHWLREACQRFEQMGAMGHARRAGALLA
jgi:hypothetical protein